MTGDAHPPYAWTEEDAGALLDFCQHVEVDDYTVPLRVWAHESNNDPRAHNPNGDASGVFQLMPLTAKAIGYPVETDPHLERFRSLSVAEQLVWAEKYYGSHCGKVSTVGRFYVCTFLPALLEKSDSPVFALAARHGPFEMAYLANWRAFDRAGKGWINVQDLIDAADRAYGPRAQAIASLVQQVLRERDTPAEPIATALPDVTPDKPNTPDDPDVAG